MSEWLSNEKQELVNGEKPKGDPLEVSVINVDDAMFVTCLPSPRNSMDHLRRNSQSAGSAKMTDNSVGSAKKVFFAFYL